MRGRGAGGVRFSPGKLPAGREGSAGRGRPALGTCRRRSLAVRGRRATSGGPGERLGGRAAAVLRRSAVRGRADHRRRRGRRAGVARRGSPPVAASQGGGVPARSGRCMRRRARVSGRAGLRPRGQTSGGGGASSLRSELLATAGARGGGGYPTSGPAPRAALAPPPRPPPRRRAPRPAAPAERTAEAGEGGHPRHRPPRAGDPPPPCPQPRREREPPSPAALAPAGLRLLRSRWSSLNFPFGFRVQPGNTHTEAA